MRKRTVWILILAVALGGIAYVGSAHFNNFNGMFSNPSCKTECYENGKRIR